MTKKWTALLWMKAMYPMRWMLFQLTLRRRA